MTQNDPEDRQTPTQPGGLNRAAEIDLLLGDAGVQAALQHLQLDDEQTLLEQVAIARIPAPTGDEGLRARFMQQAMADAGLTVQAIDAVGNVAAHYPGSPSSGAPTVISAHLDTVFDAATPIEIVHDGAQLTGPGVSDDARGLAALLALARALRAGGVSFEHPLWFAATVGEEGTGDLRGVRHLFSAEGHFGEGCRGFISLDGAGVGGVVTRGVGSLRYRIALQGPGGHPWADAATPSPIHALGCIVGRLSQLPLPSECTVNAGRWGGGTSVNSIATDAWVEVELRATEPTHLESLNMQLHDIVRAECAGLSGPGRGPKLVSSLSLLGSRPAGVTPDDSPLVQAALDATSALGGRADTGASSTDANGPMAQGIAAITMGAGGQAGLAHTPSEWYHNSDGPKGIARALLTLLLFDRS